MKKKSEKRRTSPPEDWQEFQIYFNEIIELSKKIISDHNVFIQQSGNFKAQYTIEKTKEILDKLKKFEVSLPAYESRYGSEIGWYTLEVNMTVYLIQLNKVLQSRNSFLAVRNIKSNYKAKAFLEESLYYVNEAIKYRDKHTKHYANAFEAKLELDREDIRSLLARYQPIKDPNEIDALLVSARSDKDINRAYETFQKARELASNDYSKQFQIAIEQADFYFIKNDLVNASFDKLTQVNIDHYFDCIVKSTMPLIIASNLITMNKLVNNVNTKIQCEVVSDKLYTAARNLHELSKHTKDLDRQITILKHANTNLIWGIKLARKIKYKAKVTSITPSALQEDIESQLKSLELIKEEKLKELSEKNKQAAEMVICIAEYDKKFADLLKQFDIPKKILKKCSVVQAEAEVNQSVSEESTSSSSSEVENEEPKKSFTSIINFDLEFNIKLFEDAKKENNSAQQIYIAVCIGDHLQWKAGRNLKKKEYDNAIENLKLTIVYFTQAYQLLADTKSSADTEASQKEIWLQNLLQTTNEILTRTLNAHINIQQRFEYTRHQAMQYIINKYGPQAWFKPNEIAHSMSIHAQILQETKQKVVLLEKMQKEFQRNFQIQLTEPPKIASNLVAHSAIYRPAVPVANKQEAPVISTETLS